MNDENKIAIVTIYNMQSIKVWCVMWVYILIWSVFCLILLVFPSYFSASYCLTSTIISWMRKVGWGMITSECQWSSEVTINNGVLRRRGKLCEKRCLWKTRMEKIFIIYSRLYVWVCNSRFKEFLNFSPLPFIKCIFFSKNNKTA